MVTSTILKKLKKPTFILLVFLFIFSTPGLALAADEAATSDSSATTIDSAQSESADTAEQTSDDSAITAEQTPAESDTISDEKDSESQQTLLDEEEPTDTSIENKKAAEKRFNLETDSATGALIYTFPISVPPGRNNLQPDLKLSYNNQSRDNDNWFGFGWSINIPYIERMPKKGVNALYSQNYFNSSLSGELEDVNLTDGTHGEYGTKVENGDFLKYEYNSNNYWLVTDKRGTVYKFGYNAGARQDDPNDSTHAFKWMLEEVRDTNSNYIKYEYYKDSGQIYPLDIIYTGYNTTDGIFEIDFSRESRNDDLNSYKTGFEVTTDYRISQIQTKVNGTWVKKYDIDYTAGDNGARSLIDTITESGQDGQSNVITLPANFFDYQTKTKSWTQDTGYTIPVTLGDQFDPGTRIADVNGDGLPDLIQAYGYYYNDEFVGQKKVYINKGDGTGWEYDSNYIVPIVFVGMTSDTGARLADVNGDGLVDIVWGDGIGQYEIRKVYINKGDGTGWGEDSGWVLPVAFG
ncbi:MAG: SpvB/TcaC N-terminal domain-containing protein, partial [Patescibacteria group bacterium]|nr:SpvB/TcaC N-terminal domain-containing protein [Patescibacteria group bacterium]